VTLAPLRDVQVSELYTDLLDGLAIPDHLRDSLVRSAAGNPLYAYEYARTLSEQMRMRHDGPIDAPGMPPAVEAIIANRLDLLEPADRTVLQAAAVVGTEFWPAAVAAATGLPVRAIERALRRLEQRDLVHEQESSTVAWQPQYRFGHELVREVCYQRLPRAERVTRHSRIAEWLEGHCGESPRSVEVVASHRDAAEQLAGELGQDASGYHAVPAAGSPAALSTARPGSRRRTLVPCATAARRSGSAG
jgi:predicted ATPase